MELVYAPISIGELIDKITILNIKISKLPAHSSENVNVEITFLTKILEESGIQIDPDLLDQLQSINSKLWQIEDQIRRKEAALDFGSEFVDLARHVYLFNDKRSEIKRQINLQTDSKIVEEKSYPNYLNY